MMRISFDKHVLVPLLASLIFAGMLYYFIPLIQNIKFFSNMVISHYLSQCRVIVLFLPFCILLYGFRPLRKFFDFEKWVSPLKEKYFLILVFILAFISTNFISFFIYHHMPQGDAVILFLQGKIFSKFQRWVAVPLYPEFFLREIVVKDGKWFGMMPPGHSIFLAIGMIFRIPWVISPLMGSISVVIFYFLIKDIYNETLAKSGALLLVLSPTFLFISSSMLSQNSSYFFSLLAIFFLIKSLKSKRTKLILFSGISLGVAFLCRPQIPLMFFIVSLIFLIYKTRSFKYTFIFSAGFVFFLILQLMDNYILTGNPFHYGYNLYISAQYHGIGFGAGKGPSTYGIHGHNLLKSFINLFYNLFVLSLHLFGFPLISLLFIPFAFKKPDKYELLSGFYILSAFIFWFFYWFHGISPMGPKYYYEILPFLIILTVTGIYKINVNIRPLIGILLMFNVLIYIPQNARIFKIWGSKPYAYDEIKKENIHYAIVFVKDVPDEIPFSRLLSKFNYFSLAFRNDVDIEKSDIIYAYDLGKENKRLIELYPDRDVYILECNDFNKFHLKKLK